MSTATAPLRIGASPLAYARDLVLLSKPRLSGLVVLTCAGGLALAPGEIALPRAILAVLGTAAVVGAANALNSWVERDSDGLMRRTRDRPLPAGRVEPMVALALGVAVPVFAIPILALVANPLTALLAFVALVTYVLVYTPMKKRSTLALFVGTIPGAIPPLMGWTAVTGRLDAGGLAVLDPASLRWWSPEEFREKVHGRDEVDAFQHVTVLRSEEPGGTRLHTRGLVKFGRPDLSVCGVQPSWYPDAVELVERLTWAQVRGHVIPEGQAIRMTGVPDGLVCRRAGSPDDPELGNVHVRIAPA